MGKESKQINESLEKWRRHPQKWTLSQNTEANVTLNIRRQLIGDNVCSVPQTIQNMKIILAFNTLKTIAFKLKLLKLDNNKYCQGNI
jgi:hypothetical protein